MNLKEYFAVTPGRGLLATADDKGRVDVAVYATPHDEGDRRVSFLMRDRLTHANLQTNPHAAYIFLEDGPGYRGVRLFLTKVGESSDDPRIGERTRRHLSPVEDEALGPKFLVTFQVDRVLPLVGSGG